MFSAFASFASLFAMQNNPQIALETSATITILPNLIAAVSVIIASIGLICSFFALRRQVRHDQVSVLPDLRFDYSLASIDESWCLSIENPCLRPAKITKIKCEDISEYGKSAFKEHIDNIKSEVGISRHITINFLNEGQMVPVGAVGRKNLLELPNEGLTEEDKKAFKRLLDKLEIEVNYCSVYNTDHSKVKWAGTKLNYGGS